MELRAILRREVSFFKSVVAFCHFICNLWSIKKEKKKKREMKMFPAPLWGGGILCRLLKRGGTWAGLVLGTLHEWNSSCVRAQQPGLPPSFAGLI